MRVALTESLKAAKPIFIVGPPRSGTTMLREALNRSPGIYIGPETHFFDDLRPSLGGTAPYPLPSNERKRVEDFFLALIDQPYGFRGNAGNVSHERERLRADAEESGGSADAYFRAYCERSALAKGASRWGEKTPRHIFRWRDMLTAFPGAQIVCMVREPCAIVASYRDWTKDAASVGGARASRESVAREAARIRSSADVVTSACLCGVHSSRLPARLVLPPRAPGIHRDTKT